MSLTPMMQQYMNAKEMHPDSLIFFRCGDFYELFGEDAKIAAKSLDITLTSRDRNKDNEERLPMCGVPYHAVNTYLEKLIKQGFKVAICEQLEDPKQAKGIVKRDVVRVITPGTYLEGQMDEKRNLYLVSIIYAREQYGLAVVDLSTGEFKVSSFGATAKIEDELARIQPAEILIATNSDSSLQAVIAQSSATITQTDPRSWVLESCRRRLIDHFQIHSLKAVGVKDDVVIQAAGAILQYIQETQQASLTHISQISSYRSDEFLQIDGASNRNLELTKTIREGRKHGSLLGTIDHTRTSMGGRLLRSWIEKPLIDITEIQTRQDAIGCLLDARFLLDELSDHLENVLDLERLLSKLVYGTGNARDLVALRLSLAQIPAIRSSLSNATDSFLQNIHASLDPLPSLCQQIATGIVDEPPISLRDGNLIKSGFNTELDTLRRASKEGKQWITALETQERNRTGIKSLKVGFNKVFGYYIEITKTHMHNAPVEYERKQTLANAERFITPELKEKEALILGAEERIADIEYALFCEIRNQVTQYITPIQQNAHALATLDAVLSLSVVARNQNYVCPEMLNDTTLEIINSRHPVIETMQTDFVPNDFHFSKDEQLVLLTGPNMAGKSTYLRQAALIVILAQIGSYVPASKAKIGIVDRIFTRIGAADDLSTGQSTFMVECAETANLLINATHRSLIILDELGRGTSTFDGMAIAQGVIEYIHNKIKARTLFSTHYHELTRLSETLKRLVTFRMAVEEKEGQVYFLHKVVLGNADKSYGINVAKMAGIPQPIIERSQKLLYQFEADQQKPLQLHLFQSTEYNEVTPPIPHPMIVSLMNMDLNCMTPIQAFEQLVQWQSDLEKDGD